MSGIETGSLQGDTQVEMDSGRAGEAASGDCEVQKGPTQPQGLVSAAPSGQASPGLWTECVLVRSAPERRQLTFGPKASCAMINSLLYLLEKKNAQEWKLERQGIFRVSPLIKPALLPLVLIIVPN